MGARWIGEVFTEVFTDMVDNKPPGSPLETLQHRNGPIVLLPFVFLPDF